MMWITRGTTLAIPKVIANDTCSINILIPCLPNYINRHVPWLIRLENVIRNYSTHILSSIPSRIRNLLIISSLIFGNSMSIIVSAFSCLFQILSKFSLEVSNFIPSSQRVYDQTLLNNLLKNQYRDYLLLLEEIFC